MAQRPSRSSWTWRRWAGLVVVWMLAAGTARPVAAQVLADSSAADSTGSVLVLPNMFYTPETKIAGGLVLGYYKKLDAQSPTSSIQMALIYTQRQQFYVQMQPDAYWHEGQWRLDGEIWLSRYPNAFYGIGSAVPEEQEEEYTARIADVRAQLQRQVRPGWRIGPQLRIRSEAVTTVANGGLLDTRSIPGRTGGTTVGVGLRSTWDRRDNLYFPRQGRYAEIAGMMHSAWAEDRHTFGRLTADVRMYAPVAKSHVVAVQGYAEAVAGTAPFQLLPLLGGADLMRGYREGRYRDHLFATVQAAYRLPLFWRFKAAAFANVGQVAPRLDAFSLDDPKYAVGAGLRLRLNDEGVHGRVDYAVSPAGGALYITLREAF